MQLKTPGKIVADNSLFIYLFIYLSCSMFIFQRELDMAFQENHLRLLDNSHKKSSDFF